MKQLRLWWTLLVLFLRNEEHALCPAKQRAPSSPRLKGRVFVMRKVRGALAACLGLLAVGLPQQLAAINYAQHHRTDVLAAMALLVAPPRDAVPQSDGDGGTLTHVGPANLPVLESSYVPNDDVTGLAHYPLTSVELRDLLAGQVVHGHTHALGDTIILQDNTCYNTFVADAYVAQQFIPHVAGARTTPCKMMSSRIAAHSGGPAPLTRWQTSHQLATPHFRMVYNTLSALVIPDGSDGWQFVGLEMDCGTRETSWLVDMGTPVPVTAGPVSTATSRFWFPDRTYALDEYVYADSGDPDQPGVTGAYVWTPYCAYKSLSNANTGHAPLTSGAHWRKITVDDLPQKNVFDRCKFSSDTVGKCINLVYANTGDQVFTGCHFHHEGYAGGSECKAIGGVTMSGKFLVDNSYIAVSGIGILFLGYESGIYGLQFEDSVVRRCHFFRPLRWNPWHGDWDGIERGNKKGHLEWKRYLRALAERCVLENDWDHGVSQIYSLVMKNTSTGAGAMYRADDGTIRAIKFIDCQGPFGIGARDAYNQAPAPGDQWAAQPAVVYRQSVYQCYSSTPVNRLPRYGGYNYLIQAHRNIRGLHMEALTFLGSAADIRATIWADLDNHAVTPIDWVWRNCILSSGEYGFGSDGGIGSLSGNQYFTHGSGSSAAGLYLHLTAGTYAGGANYPNPPFTMSSQPNDFVRNYAGGDMRTALALTGAGYGGRTPGCDVEMVDALTSGCVSGVWSDEPPPPDPPPTTRYLFIKQIHAITATSRVQSRSITATVQARVVRPTVRAVHTPSQVQEL